MQDLKSPYTGLFKGNPSSIYLDPERGLVTPARCVSYRRNHLHTQIRFPLPSPFLSFTLFGRRESSTGIQFLGREVVLSVTLYDSKVSVSSLPLSLPSSSLVFLARVSLPSFETEPSDVFRDLRSSPLFEVTYSRTTEFSPARGRGRTRSSLFYSRVISYRRIINTFYAHSKKKSISGPPTPIVYSLVPVH